MATLTYPYSLATFADILKVKSATFLPSYGQEYSGQGSGVIRAKDLRPALWTATVETVTMRYDQADDVQALLEGLDGSIRTFYLYSPQRPYPRNGVVVDTSVQIKTVGTDGISISLKGLPVGAKVTRGDFLSFSYGTRPSQALHRCLQTVTADGSGNTVEFQISPAPRPGVAADIAVKLNKAFGEFRMISPFTQTSDSNITCHYDFTCIQVL